MNANSKLKKIIFYINQISDGGAERVITNLASQFADDGYESILISSFRTENEYPLSPKVKRLSLEDEQIMQSFIKRNFTRIKKLRQIIQREKPDLLVSFLMEPIIRALIASMGLNIKNIISVRYNPFVLRGGSWLLHKLIFPFASGCVFQTEYAKSFFSQKLQKKSAVILNQVNSSFFDVKRDPVNGEIITCGRLNIAKNQKLLISAVNKLHKKYPEIILKIYGIGELKDELEEQIKNLNAESFIKLMGFSGNIQDALSRAEIFAFTSDYEGMPNALMEAMAAGLPCVSTDCPCGGPKALIENNKSGILIPLGDEDELIKQLEFLVLNKDKAREIGANARQRALDFAPEKIYQHWKEYFEFIANAN